MNIEKANKTDAKQLTELTIRSKSHWNYCKQQIEAWRNDLTVTSDYLIEKEVYKLTKQSTLIGYYSFFKISNKEVKLDNLFIEPRFIGEGFGAILMKDFLQRCKDLNFERVVLDSDPNAESFYQQIGFKRIGKLETSIKDRYTKFKMNRFCFTFKICRISL